MQGQGSVLPGKRRRSMLASGISLLRTAVRALRWEVLTAVGLTLFLLLGFLLQQEPHYTIDLGQADNGLALTGFYEVESIGGLDCRWSQERAQVPLAGVGPGTWILSMRIAAFRPATIAPAVVEIWVNGQLLSRFTPGSSSDFKIYTWTVTIPGAGATQASLELRSTPFTPENDPRSLGVAVDWIAVRPMRGQGRPSWSIVAGVFSLLLSGSVLLRGVGVKRGLAWAAMLPLAIVAGALLHYRMLRGLLYVPRVGLLLLFLALATALVAWGAKWLHRSDSAFRRVWIVFVVAAVIRVGIILWPGGHIHDLSLQLGFLQAFQSGQWGMIWAPFEFGQQQAYYPLAYYALPASLAALGLRADLALEITAALLDAVAVLLIYGIARQVSQDNRVAFWAAVLYAAMPINLALLWWGFFSNAFGQVVMMALLLYLTHFYGRLQRPVVLGGGIALVALLGVSHIGVAITAAVWLAGTFLLLVCFPGREDRRQVLWFGVMLLGGALLVLLYMAPSLPIYWHSARNILASPEDHKLFDRAGAFLSLFGKGILTGYMLWPLLLLPMGAIGLIRARSRSPWPQLLLGTILAALLFFLMELSSDFAVRYLLFLCPVICICAGWCLSWLWERCGSAVRLVVILGCAALQGYGLYHWVLGVVWAVKISGTPFIH